MKKDGNSYPILRIEKIIFDYLLTKKKGGL